MSMCKICNNLLKKDTSGDVLKHKCATCGNEFPSQSQDTLIYNSDNKTFNVRKSGKCIWGYPCNQKILQECPSCKYKLIAWELDHLKEKVYGCQCGYSWKNTIANQN
jgi:DNA-directed RNA polymerase subunit M/transcription elongation factor TFIIS